jgi:hypothetical protein
LARLVFEILNLFLPARIPSGKNKLFVLVFASKKNMLALTRFMVM